MGKIATRAECNSIASGSFSGDTSRCPTYSEITATGKLNVSGSYDSNQLVQLSDLSKAVVEPVTRTCRFNNNSDELLIIRTLSDGKELGSYYVTAGSSVESAIIAESTTFEFSGYSSSSGTIKAQWYSYTNSVEIASSYPTSMMIDFGSRLQYAGSIYFTIEGGGLLKPILACFNYK